MAVASTFTFLEMSLIIFSINFIASKSDLYFIFLTKLGITFSKAGSNEKSSNSTSISSSVT